jgi:hypothetical protein
MRVGWMMMARTFGASPDCKAGGQEQSVGNAALLSTWLVAQQL